MDARNIALALTKKLIEAVRLGKYEDERLFAKILPKLLSEFPDISWVLLGQSIAADRKVAWRFETILGEHFSFGDQSGAPILQISEDALFAWAHANPEVGPAFIAKVVPLLETQPAADGARRFHPAIKRLLDEFGAREDVRNQLHANIHTFGWTGSLTNYYALYEHPLEQLGEHPVAAVRRWAKQVWGEMRRQISIATDEDEERNVF